MVRMTAASIRYGSVAEWVIGSSGRRGDDRHVTAEFIEDPRVVRTKAAVLDAATTLLAEGASTFTIEAVSARSGVAKTTIYPHWAFRAGVFSAVGAIFASRASSARTGT